MTFDVEKTWLISNETEFDPFFNILKQFKIWSVIRIEHTPSPCCSKLYSFNQPWSVSLQRWWALGNTSSENVRGLCIYEAPLLVRPLLPAAPPKVGKGRLWSRTGRCVSRWLWSFPTPMDGWNILREKKKIEKRNVTKHLRSTPETPSSNF